MRDWRQTYEYSLGTAYTPWGMTNHLRVWRSNGKDKIPWDVLQQIKDDVLGEDATAIEVYPPTAELVDETNMRHLWECPATVRVPSLVPILRYQI